MHLGDVGFEIGQLLEVLLSLRIMAGCESLLARFGIPCSFFLAG
jgi:hypothetical protein